MTTKDTVTETVEKFLADWDRHEWMRTHGTWASEAWDEDRAAYQSARDRLAAAIDGLDRDEAREALADLEAAAAALKGEVRPDGGDFIAEGTIDPGNIQDRALRLDESASWTGWACDEGWIAYRVGDALAINWYREAWGGRHRHERDLWLIVDPEYFQYDRD